MSKVNAIALRELKNYFVSPLAYVVAALFMAGVGFLFYAILLSTREASLRALFQNMAVVFLLLVPSLTMRLLAEERKMGTIELLMTSPLTDAAIVWGKFLASVIYLAFLFLLTGIFPLAIIMVGGKPEIAPLLTGYLAIFLMGASFMAIGLLASSLTSNQIVAALIAFTVSLIIWLLPAIGSVFGSPVSEGFQYMSIIQHLENMARGVLDSSDLLYYFSLIGACIFLTVRSVNVYHWR
ncbi:MAG: ABC transporter permease subunit [Cyanobacteria bacterium NC_groundwater_1444_Ag_S-0.65um_54_12]|nr:ABC transporter permease subunit [Cyanobacteria bacterium NC_groundwater_1444_Ag_S-0.65um_54_12]